MLYSLLEYAHRIYILFSGSLRLGAIPKQCWNLGTGATGRFVLFCSVASHCYLHWEGWWSHKTIWTLLWACFPMHSQSRYWGYFKQQEIDISFCWFHVAAVIWFVLFLTQQNKVGIPFTFRYSDSFCTSSCFLGGNVRYYFLYILKVILFELSLCY